MSTRTVLAAVVALLVIAAPVALAKPEPTTGGVTVSDGDPTGGVEGGGPSIAPDVPAPSTTQPGPTSSPSAPASGSSPSLIPRLSQNGGATPAQNGSGDPDVVDVPVPGDQNQADQGSGGGGLASTGFAAAMLALMGLTFGAVGLTLLRLSSPARRHTVARRAAARRAAAHGRVRVRVR